MALFMLPPLAASGLDGLRGARIRCELLVDLKGRCLIDRVDLTSIALKATQGHLLHLNSVAAAQDEFAKLLAEFPSVVQPSFHQATVQHGVEHFIPTTGPPLHSRAR